MGAVGIACFVAMSKWRCGVTLWFIAAILQDPVRKVTPESPPYLTVAFVPIYLCTFLGLCGYVPALRVFRRMHPRLAPALAVFVACLSASFVLTLRHGLEFVPMALVGAFSYAGGVPALLIGFFFLRKGFKDLDDLLILFVVVTALMLIGVPLEQAGIKFSLPWLGTISKIGEWRRWYSEEGSVAMISGFYRSPEIMGWHAMALVISCIYLIQRRPSWAWIWASLTAWGGYAVLMSGRRKMYLMILVFVLVNALMSQSRVRSRFLSSCLILALCVVPFLFYFVEDDYLKTAESGLTSAGTRVVEKGVIWNPWIFQLVGPFGYGVGTKTQGAQHLSHRIQVPLVEGGMEKILVELGCLGFLASLFVLATMAAIGWRNLRLAPSLGFDSSGPITCFAMVAANLSAFLISFQFFGDPFVMTFLGLLVGILFSTERLIHEQVIGLRQQEWGGEQRTGQAGTRTTQRVPSPT